jgi:multiple sugar transport system permease protein
MTRSQPHLRGTGRSPATSTRPTGRRLPKATKRFKSGEAVGLAFVTPYAVFLAAIFAYPLGIAVYMSFHDWFFAAPGAAVDRPFVGLANYVAVFTDPAILRAFGNIAIFLVINVPLTVGLSLVLASALNAAIPFRTFFRVSFYVPYVTASVAVVGVWLFLFNSDGLVNSVLGPLAPDPSWLVNSDLAMPIVAVFVTWKQLGFFILLYLAALQNVPKELYESAAVDGASRVRSFWTVTVPGVRPATTLVVLLATITGAAIGIVLVIGTLTISLINRFLLERD